MRLSMAALIFPAFLVPGIAESQAAAYDPLQIDQSFKPATVDVTVKDAARQREIPLRVYLPESRRPAPVVVFSHGLGGWRLNNAFLGRHWAARGYAAVFLQHAGSDDSVWRGKPLGEALVGMSQAASVDSFLLRVNDVTAALDQLERWNAGGGPQLAGRLEMSKVGMSGHSFGAITTQALSGQSFAFGDFRDRRIKAAVALSPSSPPAGTPAQAFGKVDLPWLLMTGTEDVVGRGLIDVPSRLAVYASLPPGGKYELVLSGARHLAFSDVDLPGLRGPRNPNHHRAIQALSTAFWDAYLLGDPAAKAWLDGQGPRSVLERGDSWKRK